MATSQSDEPAWCSKELVLATHAETLDRFGGTAGLRDEGRLESARSRPQNRSTGRDVSDSLAAAREAWSAGPVDTRARLRCPQAGPSSMLKATPTFSRRWGDVGRPLLGPRRGSGRLQAEGPRIGGEGGLMFCEGLPGC